nr:T9SS type A sorting domain-containing protein [uncultured Dyadobacter sp.]
MRKIFPLLLFTMVTLQLQAQTIQATLRFGSDPKEQILTIRNNSLSNVAGNITKVQFTVFMNFGDSYPPMDALKFLSVSTLPAPNTGSFSTNSFMSFLSFYLATTWTGSKAVDLDPGEEMDFVVFSLRAEVPNYTTYFSPLRMVYSNPMFAAGRVFTVELDGVSVTDNGFNRFYASGPSVTVTNSADYSDLVLTNFTEANLPVKLKTFEARPEGQEVRLVWSTSEEENSDYFSIEHSLDAKQWSDVGRVESVGESKVLRNYGFTHSGTSPGGNYYRLKMVDTDETYAYSKIVNVDIEDGKENAVYPNPATNTITFTKAVAPDSKVRILDVSGKVVYSSVRVNPFAAISLDHLSSGQFFVEVEDVKARVTRYKVVKK